MNRSDRCATSSGWCRPPLAIVAVVVALLPTCRSDNGAAGALGDSPALTSTAALEPPQELPYWGQVSGYFRQRFEHAMVYDSDRRRVVMFGGETPAGVGRNETWEWDGTSWNLAAASGPIGRYQHAMAYDAARRQVVLFGGNTSTSSIANLADTWLWNGTAWTQAQVSGPSARSGHAMAYDSAAQQIVLFGGEDATGYRDDTWVWNGTAWSPLVTTGSPDPRREAAMVFDAAASRMVLTGGTSWDDVDAYSFANNDTWLLTGATWTFAAPTPTALSSHAMAYDSTRGLTVLFGAFSGGKTWEWNGSGWAEVATTGPSTRVGHAMVYDSGAGQTLLFGASSWAVPADTWRWDGTVWSVVTPATDPGVRSRAAAAYDAGRRVVVLFGGAPPSSASLGDTWEWDGSSWRLVATSGPSARQDHAMAYHASLGQVVLFGGTGANDTWLWNGTTWTATNPPVKPTARSRHAMAYDPSRDVTVLYGGSIGRNETWEWNGSTWTQRATGPAPSELHGLTYDPAAGAVVLAGGDVAGTWAWDGSSWRQLSPVTAFGDVALVYDGLRARLVAVGRSGAGCPTWEWNGTSWFTLNAGDPRACDTAAIAYDRNRGVTVLFSSGGSGQTWELHTLGGPCTSDADCGLSYCVDGVCCTQPSCGVCAACNTPGNLGACAPILAAADPDTCTGTSACNARGVCAVANGSACNSWTECASEHCADGVCCDSTCAAPCDVCTAAAGAPQDGVCGVATVGYTPGLLCNGYSCDGLSAACATTCESDATCAPTRYCSAQGTCVARKGVGETCNLELGGDCATPDCRVCASAHCVDGFCCDSACTEPCGACSVARGAVANGRCDSAAPGTDPGPACADGYGCDGTSMSCATHCAADQDCQSSHFCAADGSCTTRKPTAAACDPTAGGDCLVADCRVCAGDHCLNGSCCDVPCEQSCAVCADKTAAGLATLLTPGENALAVTLSPELCWAAVTGSTPITYELEVARDPAFAAVVVARRDLAATCARVGALAAGTRYYWRVRADNAYLPAGPWSAGPRSFETGFPPLAVEAVYPVDDAAEVAAYLPLRWRHPTAAPGSEPACYEVGFGRSDDEAMAAATASTGCGPTGVIGPLALTTPYRWCVAGWNSFGEGPWTCFGFTTGSMELPGPVTWLSPTDGAAAVGLTPTLRWTVGSGPLPDGYQVGLAATALEAETAYLDLPVTSLVWPTSLQPQSSYLACARPTLSVWVGGWSCVAFTTGNAPLPPTSPAPTDGAAGLPRTVALSWTAAAGGAASCWRAGYGATDVEARAAAVPTPNCEAARLLTGLAPASPYRWCVRGENDFGHSDWACFGFSTAAVALPEPPVWLRPTADEIGVVLSPELTWTAGPGPRPSCYRVGIGASDVEAKAQPREACGTSLTWPTPLATASHHVACVRGELDGNFGGWACVAFTTGAVPGAPTPVFPPDGAADVLPPDARLAWLGAAGDVRPSGYRVRIWEANQPQAVRELIESGLATEIAVAAATDYRWTVTAYNAIGEGTPSAVGRFSTVTAADELRAVPVVDPGRGIERVTQHILDGSHSTARRAAPIVAYAWQAGDGSPVLRGERVGYVYPLAGGYQARLRIDDSAGGAHEAKAPLLVATTDGRVPPIVRAEVDTAVGAVPLTVRFTAASGSGSGQLVALVWTLGDGTTDQGESLTHTYTGIGTYLARVTAVDNQGLSATDFVIVSVVDSEGTAAPRVQVFANPPVIRVGGSVALECVAPPERLGSLSYAWDGLKEVGADAGATPAPVVFTAAGAHEVGCTVVDATTGYSARATVEIQVLSADGLLPPSILTVGATRVCAGEAYLYNDGRRAAARGSAPILWLEGKVIGDDVVAAPEGFTVESGTGVVRWTPSREQIGPQQLAITARNAAGTAVQELEVTVEDCEPAPAELPPADRGCGCQSGGSGLATLLAAALIAVRRRPRRSASAPCGAGIDARNVE